MTRILHVLDHSLPLHSGYTFRTRAILKAQEALATAVEKSRELQVENDCSREARTLLEQWAPDRFPPLLGEIATLQPPKQKRGAGILNAVQPEPPPPPVEAQLPSVIDEQVLRIDCEGARLWGILARPGADRAVSGTAVLIVVGGPQYRAGSHRQFVLLARALAAAGHPTLRFDYTGMGDSEGEPRAFDAVGPDIRAALDALAEACPECTRLAVWGLCDAASAALMFATRDPRVAGIAACNPWARSEATLAAATVKHYYTARLLQPEFWRKLSLGIYRSLWSRIHCRISLEPPKPEDTVEYIQYRVERVGGKATVFASDALALIHEATAGQLRDIDRIATACLRTAARRKLKHVDRELLQDVVDNDISPD